MATDQVSIGEDYPAAMLLLAESVLPLSEAQSNDTTGNLDDDGPELVPVEPSSLSSNGKYSLLRWDADPERMRYHKYFLASKLAMSDPATQTLAGGLRPHLPAFLEFGRRKGFLSTPGVTRFSFGEDVCQRAYKEVQGIIDRILCCDVPGAPGGDADALASPASEGSAGAGTTASAATVGEATWWRLPAPLPDSPTGQLPPNPSEPLGLGEIGMLNQHTLAPYGFLGSGKTRTPLDFLSQLDSDKAYVFPLDFSGDLRDVPLLVSFSNGASLSAVPSTDVDLSERQLKICGPAGKGLDALAWLPVDLPSSRAGATSVPVSSDRTAIRPGEPDAATPASSELLGGDGFVEFSAIRPDNSLVLVGGLNPFSGLELETLGGRALMLSMGATTMVPGLQAPHEADGSNDRPGNPPVLRCLVLGPVSDQSPSESGQDRSGAFTNDSLNEQARESSSEYALPPILAAIAEIIGIDPTDSEVRRAVLDSQRHAGSGVEDIQSALRALQRCAASSGEVVKASRSFVSQALAAEEDTRVPLSNHGLEGSELPLDLRNVFSDCLSRGVSVFPADLLAELLRRGEECAEDQRDAAVGEMEGRHPAAAEGISGNLEAWAVYAQACGEADEGAWYLINALYSAVSELCKRHPKDEGPATPESGEKSVEERDGAYCNDLEAELSVSPTPNSTGQSPAATGPECPPPGSANDLANDSANDGTMETPPSNVRNKQRSRSSAATLLRTVHAGRGQSGAGFPPKCSATPPARKDRSPSPDSPTTEQAAAASRVRAGRARSCAERKSPLALQGDSKRRGDRAKSPGPGDFKYWNKSPYLRIPYRCIDPATKRKYLPADVETHFKKLRLDKHEQIVHTETGVFSASTKVDYLHRALLKAGEGQGI